MYNPHEKIFVLIDGTAAFTRAAAGKASPAQSAFRAAVAHVREKRADRHYPATVHVWSNNHDEWLTPGDRGVTPARYDAMAKIIDDNMAALGGSSSLSAALDRFAARLADRKRPLPAQTRLLVVTAVPHAPPYLRAAQEKSIARTMEKLAALCPQLTIDIVAARDNAATPVQQTMQEEDTAFLMALATRHKALTVYPCTDHPAELSAVVGTLLADRARVIAPPHYRTFIAPRP